MLINGKGIAEEIRGELQHTIKRLKGRPPCLAAILVGDDPASQIYVRNKIRACEEIGIVSERHILPKKTSQKALLELIQKLSTDLHVDGILVQLPLPNQINPLIVAAAIDPEKDVDGVSPISFGKLLMGDTSGFIPCTPRGIQALLVKSDVQIEGQHIVIAGRSNIVGKPLAALLMQKAPNANATVTVVHSQSKQLIEIVKTADILIAAIGKPNFFTATMIKKGAVIIDVGVNRIEDSTCPSGYRLLGDVDIKSVQRKCAMISPVPGGVGPMTIAMLLSNTLQARKSSSSR